MTRSSRNWLRKPGSVDPINTARSFLAQSLLDIPNLPPQDFGLPEDLRLLS